jgi:hypothetical protein
MKNMLFMYSIPSYIPSYFWVVCWFVYSARRIYTNILNIKNFMHYAHPKQKLLVYITNKHNEYSGNYIKLDLKRDRT